MIIVDECDLELLGRYKWRVDKRGYVYRSSGWGRVLLHREIMKPRPGLVVDHINGEPTDNRRANLRVCSQSENALNSHHLRTDNKSGVRGVYFFKGKWVAFCKRKYLGRFSSLRAAKEARDKAAFRKST